MLTRVFPAVMLALVLPFTPPLHAADVAGHGQFVLQTDGGPREAPVELALDGETVSGTWDGPTKVAGTFKDGALTLSFPLYSPDAGFTATLTIKGQLEADAITGTWAFGEYSGPFKATRVP